MARVAVEAPAVRQAAGPGREARAGRAELAERLAMAAAPAARAQGPVAEAEAVARAAPVGLAVVAVLGRVAARAVVEAAA